jgi:hypothetical protein
MTPRSPRQTKKYQQFSRLAKGPRRNKLGDLAVVAGCNARRPTRRSASTLGGPLQGAGNAAVRPLRPAKLPNLFCAGPYVPLALLLLALNELAAAPKACLIALGIVLFIARIFHVIGMPRPAPNLFRLLGVLGTFGVLLGVLLGACATGVYVLLA